MANPIRRSVEFLTDLIHQFPNRLMRTLGLVIMASMILSAVSPSPSANAANGASAPLAQPNALETGPAEPTVADTAKATATSSATPTESSTATQTRASTATTATLSPTLSPLPGSKLNDHTIYKPLKYLGRSFVPLSPVSDLYLSGQVPNMTINHTNGVDWDVRGTIVGYAESTMAGIVFHHSRDNANITGKRMSSGTGNSAWVNTSDTLTDGDYCSAGYVGSYTDAQVCAAIAPNATFLPLLFIGFPFSQGQVVYATLSAYGGPDQLGHTFLTNVHWIYAASAPAMLVHCNCPPKNGQGDSREAALNGGASAQGFAGDPINTSTGGLDFSWEDMSIPSIAGSLAFQRTYSSLATNQFTTTLGYGWTDNQDARLLLPLSGGAGSVVYFKSQYGNKYQFTASGSGSYTAYVGVLASLSYDTPSASYWLTASDQSSYVFDSTGLLKTWTSSQGHSLTYNYDGQGNVITVTETASQRYLVLAYDNQTRITSVRDQAGRQVSYGYDITTGDLVTVTDVLNQNWTYAYSGTTHLLTDVLDPRGITIIHNSYDGQGRVITQSNALGNTSAQVVYNLNGTRVITDARGISQTHTYDGRNTLIIQVDSLGSSVARSYDTNFRPSGATDALGHPITITWSFDGADLNQLTNALNQTTQLGYDRLNNLTQSVDARSQITKYTYSGSLLTTKTDPLLHTSLYTYTAGADAPVPVGLLKASSDPLVVWSLSSATN